MRRGEGAAGQGVYLVEQHCATTELIGVGRALPRGRLERRVPARQCGHLD